MNRKILLWIGICLAGSVGIVAMLFAMSFEMRRSQHNFLRLFPSHPVIEGNYLDLTFDSYYIAGVTGHQIVLGNYSAPLHVVILNENLRDTVHATLNVEGIREQKFWSLRLAVNSPDFFLYDGTVSKIYKGNIETWKAKPMPHLSEYFVDLAPIGSSSFVIKSLEKSGTESIIGKISGDPPRYVFKNDILKRQVDGYFCTDGHMKYVKDLNAIIYLYKYRNEYLLMDTALQIYSKGRTIDTISHARIKVATLRGTNTRKLAAPPLYVNNRFTTYKRYLFVHSALLARNEHPDALTKASVIDVYDITNNEYKFSFYIYHFKGKEKLTDIKIAGEKLIVLFGSNIQSFDLNDNYFPSDL